MEQSQIYTGLIDSSFQEEFPRYNEKTGTQINNSYDLSAIKDSSADEIFHRNQPVLAVEDIASRFCVLSQKFKV